jgi:osmotically inducible protein OsmC
MAIAIQMAETPERMAASTVTLDENGGVPSIVSSHLEVTARVPGLDLIDSDAETGETSWLYPVSRLFAGAKTTVSAALKSAS